MAFSGGSHPSASTATRLSGRVSASHDARCDTMRDWGNSTRQSMKQPCVVGGGIRPSGLRRGLIVVGQSPANLRGPKLHLKQLPASRRSGAGDLSGQSHRIILDPASHSQSAKEWLMQEQSRCHLGFASRLQRHRKPSPTACLTLTISGQDGRNHVRGRAGRYVISSFVKITSGSSFQPIGSRYQADALTCVSGSCQTCCW